MDILNIQCRKIICVWLFTMGNCKLIKDSCLYSIEQVCDYTALLFTKSIDFHQCVEGCQKWNTHVGFKKKSLLFRDKGPEERNGLG